MEAKELRIGNLVKANCIYEGEVKTFERLNENLSVAFFSDGSKSGIGEFLEDIQPIVITEEWLVKIGYEKMPSGTYLQPNSGNFIWFEQGLKCSIAGEYYPENIKYVHQLQNLYFALTGEELQNS